MKRSDRNLHTGSSLDSFLEEEGLLEAAEAVALKRVIAWQMQQAMQAKRINKKLMAQRLHTSRSQVDRLLDPGYVGISLEAISMAAHAVGKRVHIALVDSSHTRRKTSAKRRTKQVAAKTSRSARPSAVLAH